MATSIGNKVSKSGDTMTGDLSFGDNNKINLGAGSDLNLYHDGSDSIIEDTGTGDLIIKASQRIYMKGINDETLIRSTENSQISLYNNGAEKLSTSTDGILVYGNMSATSMGVGGINYPTSDGTANQVIKTDGAGTLAFTSISGGAVDSVNGYTGAVVLDAADVDALALTGGTLTGDVSFGDSDKAIFGAGSDLQIYHTGSDSVIQDAGQGDLYIKASNNLWFQGNTSNDIMARFQDNGAVTLYHDNSAKLATTATGIDVTGTVTADGLVVDGSSKFGGSVDESSSGGLSLKLGLIDASISNSTDAFVGVHNSGGIGSLAGDLLLVPRSSTGVDNSIRLFSGQTTPKLRQNIASNGDISFYEDTGTTAKFFWDASEETLNLTGNATSLSLLGSTQSIAGGNSNLKIGSSDAAAADKGGQLNFTANTTTLANYPVAGIHGYHETLGSGNYSGYLSLFTTSTGGAITERMRIDSSGNVGIGTASPSSLLTVSGEIIATSYNETYDALSGTTPTVDCHNGNMFSLTTSGNTTFTFSNPPASGTAFGFTLKLVAGGTHTITYPASVDWAGGTAPDAPASGETDVLVFITHDGGTTWYGFRAGDAMA